MDNLALQLARRFQPRHVLIALAAVMACFLVLDFGDAQGFSSLRFFDLNDSDVTFRIGLSPFVIGTLLLFSSAIAFSAASTAADSRAAFWFKASGVAFAFFGLEEILGVHSWLDTDHGVSWNISYLPFVALGTLAWFETARHLEAGPVRRLFFGGIAAFLGACLFDAIAHAQRDVPVDERTRGSDQVVVGRVSAVTPVWRNNDFGDRLIISIVHVSVEETLKGASQQSMDVEVEGGTIGSLTLRVSDLETFTPGERAVFYLTHSRRGTLVPHLRGLGLQKIDQAGRIRGSNATLDQVRREVRAAAGR